MAISERIRQEASRTIAGIERYYDTFGIDLDDAEEREHRIARIEAAMEGCNGLTPDEKVQKTAENVFELTCAQERAYDSMRKEIRILRDENNKEFDLLRGELREGLSGVIKKIEDSGIDNSSAGCNTSLHHHLITRLISEHPLLAFCTFCFVLLLVFISGHFDALYTLFSNGN